MIRYFIERYLYNQIMLDTNVPFGFGNNGSLLSARGNQVCWTRSQQINTQFYPFLTIQTERRPH